MENSPNKHGPCLDKNCGHCCDPIRVDMRNRGELPKDKNGKDIFVERNEILAPETHIETMRLKTFDCINFDTVTKKCLDHESRPDLCRNASCVSDPKGNIDEQHKKTVEEKFIKIYRQ